MRVIVRERYRSRRETYIHTDRQINRPRERERQRQRQDIQYIEYRVRVIERERYLTKGDIHTYIHTDRQTDRHINRPRERQRQRQRHMIYVCKIESYRNREI